MYIGCAQPISPSIVEVTTVLNETMAVYITFSNPLFESLTNKQSYFTLTDANNNVFQIVSTEEGSSASELKLNTVDFVAATNPMTVVYNNGVTVDNLVPALTVEVDNVRFAIPNTTIQFDALKEPPTGYVEDNLSISNIALALVVTQVYYSEAFGLESISTGSNLVSIIVTNVGTDPL